MTKRTQNIVAESRSALPVATGYALLVWLAAGLVQEQWWVQLACTAVAAYLMVELNNQNALIRIYSRMVSCAFLVLSCAGCFLFPSLDAALCCLSFVAFLLLLFRTYQDKQSAGGTFYAFAMLGLGSLVHVEALYFVPLYWLLMAFKVQTLSWRTLLASLLGTLLPYWFVGPWLAWTGDVTPLLDHFDELGRVTLPIDYSALTVGQVLYFALLLVVVVTGTVHHLRTRYKDKIRTRLLLDCFIITAWIAAILVAVQPQHATLLLPMLTVCASPLIAHFIALTHTRWTNIAFWIIATAALLITALNLWIPSLHF